jgi:NTE family protein
MRGLVLSGGGANGAFEVGALQHLIGFKKIHYDVICGVSVGALNGAVLAQYPKGMEDAAIKDLTTLWDGVSKNSDIYRSWYHGLLWKLPWLWKSSLYCTNPLKQLVRENVDPSRLQKSGKKFRVGAVCWNTGEYRLWGEQHKDIVAGILASSSFPVFFEPIELDGLWYTDGGLRDITPIKAAIDLGCDRIDVIQCGGPGVSSRKGRPGVIQQALAGMEILLDEVDVCDYEKAQYINRLVLAGAAPNKKLIELNRLQPSGLLGDSLDFSEERKIKNMKLGKRLAMTLGW